MALQVFRTFVAFSLTPADRKQLAHLQGDLQTQVRNFRWLREEQLHVTVAFLGEISRKQMIQAAESVVEIQEQSFKPVAVSVSKITCFPQAERARVVAAVVGGNKVKSLSRSVGQIRAKLKEDRLRFDDRPFVPHITLGRGREVRDLGHLQSRLAEPFLITPQHIGLFLSIFTTEGVKYQRIV